MQLRQKRLTTITDFSNEKAHRQVTYSWLGDLSVSFLGPQLYSMRHVQEHAAQLSLFLGQHGIADKALHWVRRAKGEPGN